MDDQQKKRILKDTFNTVSTGYDGPALRFFTASALHMAGLLGLKGDEQVLDVACGTGNAALAISSKLPRGKVTAVDFSSGMLAQARQKAATRKVGNIEFHEQDMQALSFPDDSFDVATCAFGIFFVEDMDSQLARIASAIKPGGRVMIANFEESYFSPLKELFASRIQAYGVTLPPPAWKRIANVAGCRELFEKAGLADITVHQKNVGYYLTSADQWWDVVWNAGYRRLVAQLSPTDQARFKEEHLREVEALQTEKGILLDVGVLYTVGTKGKA